MEWYLVVNLDTRGIRILFIVPKIFNTILDAENMRILIQKIQSR